MLNKRTAIRLAIFATTIAWACAVAPAGEVKVIGSTWHDNEDACFVPMGYAEACCPPQAADKVVYSATPEAPNLEFPSRAFNTSWYARMEYFHWDERLDRTHQNIESGPLYTLGVEHRFGSERIRAEFFGGNMLYEGYTVDAVQETYESTFARIEYFGGRVEYEYLWDIHVDGWLPFTLYAGLGTRLWNKTAMDVHTALGEPIATTRQAWWTFYPYIGAERRWDLNETWEVFSSGRIGSTLINYCHSSSYYAPAFYPNAGITAQVKAGLRRNHFFLLGYFEAMSFQKSRAEHVHGGSDEDYYQWPTSQMYTAGFQAGFTY